MTESNNNENNESRPPGNKNNGYRAGSELIINMVAGGVFGYILDHFLNTLPLFLIIFFLTGFGWGMYKIYKITTNMD